MGRFESMCAPFHLRSAGVTRRGMLTRTAADSPQNKAKLFNYLDSLIDPDTGGIIGFYAAHHQQPISQG